MNDFFKPRNSGLAAAQNLNDYGQFWSEPNELPQIPSQLFSKNFYLVCSTIKVQKIGK